MDQNLGIIDRTYLIGRSLGVGGMGSVYQATQLVNLKQVALKLVTPQAAGQQSDGTDTSLLESRLDLRLVISREFQTLASLHHPNVIRVLSYGFDEHQGPYYTMELLTAPRTILEAGQNRSISFKVGLIAQLLRALSYIHRRNVIHRDIKPSNVLVVGDEVKLLDFGISVDREGASDLAGTIEYMAPELMLGSPPSISSDLYAVGLVLHQLLTGHLPQWRRRELANLLSDDADDEQTQHALAGTFASGTTDSIGSHTVATGQTDCTESGSHVDSDDIEIGVEGALGDIIRRMLKSAPDARYQSSDEVLRALSAAINEPIPTETSETRESFLRATLLVGRETELGALRTALDKLRQNQGSGMLIGGESGVGKSRLISELRTLALVYRFWVAEGQCTAESGVAYQEWQPLLRILCFRSDLLDDEAAIFKPLVPDIAELLKRPIPDPAPAKPEEILPRLVTTLLSIFGRLQRPAVIILEDLHWSRPESISLLSMLSKGIAGLPVLLIGTYRSDESQELPGQLPDLQNMLLRRLGADAIVQLSQSMLGPVGCTPALIDYLARQTEGNVFFLIEVVRALAEDAGELQGIGQGRLPEHILTTGIERIIERRLEHVDPAYRPALQLAAILGRRLDLGVVEHAFPTLSVRSMLLQCANAAVLESQATEWRFSHDKLRESILRHLNSEERRRLNLQAAEALEATYSGEEREPLSAQLALHFRRAEQLDRAWPYAMRAGDQSARFGLMADARAHYQDALDATAALPSSIELYRGRVDLLLRLMQSALISDSLDTQLQRASEVEALLGKIRQGDSLTRADQLRQARLDLLTGRAYHYASRARDAIKHYQRLLPLAEELGDPELKALPSAVIGQALLTQEQLEKAYPLLAGAIPPLRQQNNELEADRCRLYIAFCLAGLGKYRQSMQEFADALRSAREQKQPQLMAMGAILQALAMQCGMDWTSILASVARVGELTLKAGEKAYASLAFITEALAHAHLGNHEAARELSTRSQTLDAELGGAGFLREVRLTFSSEILLLAGNLEDALKRAQQAIEVARPTGRAKSEGIAERVVAMALSGLGAPLDEIERHFRSSIATLEDRKLILDVAQTKIAWADVCRERGRREEARQLYTAAQETFTAAGCVHLESSLASRLTDLAGDPD